MRQQVGVLDWHQHGLIASVSLIILGINKHVGHTPQRVKLLLIIWL
jgi:hypothetical protein